MLWSGFTHSALGAAVDSTGYIKIVNCAIKQSGKKSPTKCCKRHLNIYTLKRLYINAITILLPFLR